MVLIRPVGETDAPALLEIYRPYVLNNAVSFEIELPSEKAFKERISTIAGKYPFLIATENEDILGYAYASQHRERAAYRWIVETTIYLAPEARGKGIGKLLYNRLLDELSQRQFTLAYGIITLPNEASEQLHKSCGFENLVVHKNAGWKFDNWHDVLWMKKELKRLQSPPAEPIFGPAE